MPSFDNAAAIAAAAGTVTNAELQKLLTDRIHDWTALGVLDLTHLSVSYTHLTLPTKRIV